MTTDRILVVLVVAVALLALACGGPAEYQLEGSSTAAGTDGKLEVEEIEGGNNMVTLYLEFLAPPGRLAEGMSSYLLWIQPVNGDAQRAAVLEYDSEERVGTAVATTTETCFDAVVTAEAGRDAATPSTVEIVRQRHCAGE